jgi:hypothetical protein
MSKTTKSQRFLGGLGIASVLVLLVLTFLLPPLWLRVVFDLGLLGGLIWITRQPVPSAQFRAATEIHSAA